MLGGFHSQAGWLAFNFVALAVMATGLDFFFFAVLSTGSGEVVDSEYAAAPVPHSISGVARHRNDRGSDCNQQIRLCSIRCVYSPCWCGGILLEFLSALRLVQLELGLVANCNWGRCVCALDGIGATARFGRERELLAGGRAGRDCPPLQ